MASGENPDVVLFPTVFRTFKYLILMKSCQMPISTNRTPKILSMIPDLHIINYRLAPQRLFPKELKANNLRQSVFSSLLSWILSDIFTILA